MHLGRRRSFSGGVTDRFACRWFRLGREGAGTTQVVRGSRSLVADPGGGEVVQVLLQDVAGMGGKRGVIGCFDGARGKGRGDVADAEG